MGSYLDNMLLFLLVAASNVAVSLSDDVSPSHSLGEGIHEKWGFGGLTTVGSFSIVQPRFREAKLGETSDAKMTSEQNCNKWYQETKKLEGDQNCLFYSKNENTCLDDNWKENKTPDGEDLMKDGKPRSFVSSASNSPVVAESFGVLSADPDSEDSDKAVMGIVYLRRSECTFDSDGQADCSLSSNALCLKFKEGQQLQNYGKFFFDNSEGCKVVKDCALDNDFRAFLPLV